MHTHKLTHKWLSPTVKESLSFVSVCRINGLQMCELENVFAWRKKETEIVSLCVCVCMSM